MMPKTNTNETIDTWKEENSKHIIIVPTDNDVLCGRGRSNFFHKGNQRFRQVVGKSLHSYLTAPTRSQKSKIVKAVAKEVLEQGARFLKQAGGSNDWYEADIKTAQDKVGHALRDASSDKSSSIKKIHLDILRKNSEKTEKICSIPTKLSVGEVPKLAFAFPNVTSSDTDVSNIYDNDDHATTDAAESMNSTKSQVPIEKRAAEPNNMEVVDAVDNETSPDLIFSDGFYGDLVNLSAEELSPASSWGSFDDYLVIVNDIELDELDQHLP